MNSPSDDWQPDPQLLAAYFDGELEACEAMAEMRARIEAWIEANPDTAEQWASHRQLQKLWVETTPAAPSAAAWAETLERIDAERRQPRPVASRNSWWTAGVIAASIALMLSVLYGAYRLPSLFPGKDGGIVQLPQDAPDFDGEMAVLPVAATDEVTILSVEGADIEALIVGELPMAGPMDLADPGDVLVIATNCPRTNVVRQKQCRPIVWARMDAE